MAIFGTCAPLRSQISQQTGVIPHRSRLARHFQGLCDSLPGTQKWTWILDGGEVSCFVRRPVRLESALPESTIDGTAPSSQDWLAGRGDRRVTRRASGTGAVGRGYEPKRGDQAGIGKNRNGGAFLVIEFHALRRRAE
jgi:hypothetical protein